VSRQLRFSRDLILTQHSAAALKLSPAEFPEAPQIRAVALWKTGNLDGAIESAREAGVVAYLVKPFRSSEILPKLAAIVNPTSVVPDVADVPIVDEGDCDI